METKERWKTTGLIVWCLATTIIFVLCLLCRYTEIFSSKTYQDTRRVPTDFPVIKLSDHPDIRILDVAWQQRLIRYRPMFFEDVPDPEMALFFDMLIENIGDEPLRVFDTDITMLGEEIDRGGIWKLKWDPILVFPGEVRPVYAGYITFPTNLAEPLHWEKAIIEVFSTPAEEISLCKVLRWPDDDIVVEKGKRNWRGNYEISGRLEGFERGLKLGEQRPYILISYFNEDGHFVGYEEVTIRTDDTFSAIWGDEDFSVDYVVKGDPFSYQIHFIEALLPRSYCTP